jgi:GDP-4-dehydro-6-deoxy-D-mannose reductase
MRILVTGITGFAGSHLAETLISEGAGEVWGIGRRSQVPDPWPFPPDRVRWTCCDMADRQRLTDFIGRAQPEHIYHLAGYASTARSYREPDAAWEANVTATRNLFEALSAWGGQPRVLHVSSGLVYGAPRSADQLVGEETPLRPVSPYAASKAAADLAAYQVSQVPGLAVIRVRPFNHIGPRQAPDFAISHFARQIAAIEAGQQAPVIETGDLRPRRDLTDVRDMVRAYILLMKQGAVGEVYNAGSGTAPSMQDVLDLIVTQSRVRPEVRQKTEPERAREAVALRADCSKLRAATGWTPRYSLNQTLADTLDYWRSVTQSIRPLSNGGRS